jgi:16S rRNA processing protein RimM
MAEEVETREQAQALRNTRLFVPRDVLPETEEDEFYNVDLIGLEVQALDGAPLGRVRDIVSGAQDLLDIEHTPGAKSSWFLPFTKALVPVVDLKNKRLIADVPDGLIPMIGEPPAQNLDHNQEPDPETKPVFDPMKDYDL